MAAFESDIRRYAELTDEVLAESAHEPMKFLLIDCGPLKQVCWCVCYSLNAVQCNPLGGRHGPPMISELSSKKNWQDRVARCKALVICVASPLHSTIMALG